MLAKKANWLVEQGHEVVIVTTDQRGQRPFFPLDERIKCYDLGVDYEENNGKSFVNKLIHYPFKQWKHKRKLSALLHSLRADVVISMFCNDASFIPSIKDGSKKILEIHFSRFKRLQYGRKGLWKLADEYRSKQDAKVAARFDRFVVLTDEDKEYFLKFREVIEELERRCRFHKTVRRTRKKVDSQPNTVDRTRFAQLIIELAKR